MIGSVGQPISETLEKGLRILALFNEDQQGFTLTEISRRIGVNKTSAYRFVNTYCDLGYLRKDGRTKLVKLGPRTLSLAYAFIQGADYVEAIKPLVDEVHEEHNVHVDVGVLHQMAIYLIYRRETHDTAAFRHFTTGTGLHFLATGKAALAFLPEEERLSLVDRIELNPKTDLTITDRSELLDDLLKTKRRGYSYNNEEYVRGLLAIGAPLIDPHTSRVIGGISFDSSTAKHSMEEFAGRYTGLLVELAKKVSAVIPRS